MSDLRNGVMANLPWYRRYYISYEPAPLKMSLPRWRIRKRRPPMTAEGFRRAANVTMDVIAHNLVQAPFAPPGATIAEPPFTPLELEVLKAVDRGDLRRYSNGTWDCVIDLDKLTGEQRAVFDDLLRRGYVAWKKRKYGDLVDVVTTMKCWRKQHEENPSPYYDPDQHERMLALLKKRSDPDAAETN